MWVGKDGKLDVVEMGRGGRFVADEVRLGGHVPRSRSRSTYLISTTSPSGMYPARVVLATRSHPNERGVGDSRAGSGWRLKGLDGSSGERGMP